MTGAGELSESEVMTDAVRAWIGYSPGPIVLPEAIGAGDVRRYIEATGDTNPLWLDDEAARAAGYRERILPPMMVVGLSWRAGDAARLAHHVPLPEIYSDTRNAGHEIEWFEPMYIGESLTLLNRIVEIKARPGKRGLGVYITRETEYRTVADDRLIVRVRQTTVRLPRRKNEAP